MSFSYQVQTEPRGLAEALILGREFLAGEACALILGDNIFYGHGLTGLLRAAADADSATVFVYRVHDPEEYGVLELDAEGKPIEIVEKPERPRSSLAVTGLYFYPSDVVDVAASLRPSARGELEITDVNRSYLHQQRLRDARLTRGHAWHDAGTHESLVAAANCVETIEKRQGLKVACIEEVAYRMGYISGSMLAALAEGMPKSGYGAYLTQLLSDSE